MARDRFRTNRNRTRVTEERLFDPDHIDNICWAIDRDYEAKAKEKPKQSVEEFLAAGGKITKIAPGERGEDQLKPHVNDWRNAPWHLNRKRRKQRDLLEEKEGGVGT